MANEVTKQLSKEEKLAKIESTINQIEHVLGECNLVALKDKSELMQSVMLASGISQLQNAMTDEVMKQFFMPLQNSPLGFKTDNVNGYPVETVRSCMIQGMILGLRPIGNELNIISGQAYATKNGLERKVREFQGLTNLFIIPGVPHVGEKSALVPMRASWLLNGKPMELVRDVEKRADGSLGDTRIPVKVNQGMGPDAIVGKATRKMYKSILDILGGVISFEDAEVIDITGEAVAEPPAPPTLPEHEGKRVPVSGPKNGNGRAQAHVERAPEVRSEPESKEAPKQPQQATDAPSSPKASEGDTGLNPGEIKDIKRAASAAGADDIVEACELLLSKKGDFGTIGTVLEWREAHMPPMREPGAEG